METSISKKEEPGPPSYDDATSTISIDTDSSINPGLQNEIHNQLRRLGQQVSYAQEERQQKFYNQDQRTLELLTPHINGFIDDYGKSGLTRATLVIVPASMIREDATLADDDLLKADDFSRVARIQGDSESEGFWEEASVARRLAAYLQPPPVPGLEPSKDPKRSFWKKNATPTTAATKVTARYPSDGKDVDGPRVEMAVRAEEVSFRAENTLGLYEAENGWAIVVRILVNLN